MSSFFTKVIAAIMSFFSWLGLVLFPAVPVDGVFPPESPAAEKSAFDEGEFVMGEYDIIVAVRRND